MIQFNAANYTDGRIDQEDTGAFIDRISFMTVKRKRSVHYYAVLGTAVFIAYILPYTNPHGLFGGILMGVAYAQSTLQGSSHSSGEAFTVFLVGTLLSVVASYFWSVTPHWIPALVFSGAYVWMAVDRDKQAAQKARVAEAEPPLI